MSDTVRLFDLGGFKNTLTLAAKPFASGADGAIHAIEGTALAAKLYHRPSKDPKRLDKLRAMLDEPPNLPPLAANGRDYVQIAWPVGWLENHNGHFIGFAMPMVDLSRASSLENLLSAKTRRAYALPESYGYRLTAAANLASIVAELHAHHHHVVDLKPININFYTDTFFVAILDCDGFSIGNRTGERFTAHQFSDGYIAPEALQAALAPEQLGEAQDRFALAVILFQLLNQGLHPFQGVPAKGIPVPTTNSERVQRGLYAYGRQANALLAPSPWSIHDYFEDETRAYFDRAFTHAADRPSAALWRDHLAKFAAKNSGAIAVCAKDKDHAHFSKGCGLCALANKKTKGSNPFKRPSPAGPTVVVRGDQRIANLLPTPQALARLTPALLAAYLRQRIAVTPGLGGTVQISVTKSGNGFIVSATRVNPVQHTAPRAGVLRQAVQWVAFLNRTRNRTHSNPVAEAIKLVVFVLAFFLFAYANSIFRTYLQHNLLNAAKTGENKTVEWVLRQKINPDFTNPDGLTPLMLAAQNGRDAVVDTLLLNNASPDRTDRHWRTALMMAAQAGHLRTVEVLLKDHPDAARTEHDNHFNARPYLNTDYIDSCDEDGRSALMLAAKEGHLPVVEFLLKKGAAVNLYDKSMGTALTLAIATDHRTVVDMLMRAGADLRAINAKGYTDLMSTVKKRDDSPVKESLKNSAPVNDIGRDGDKAFDLAMSLERDRVSNLLYEHETDPNHAPPGGIPPLLLAAREGNLHQVKKLLAAGARIAPPPSGFTQPGTFLSIVADKSPLGNDNSVWVPDLTASNSPILAAASRGFSDVVFELLHAGADINSADSQGNTILMAAIQAPYDKDPALLRELLERGANVNDLNEFGTSALGLGVVGEKVTAVAWLLRYGADVHSGYNTELTPIRLSHRLADKWKNDNVSQFAHRMFDYGARARQIAKWMTQAESQTTLPLRTPLPHNENQYLSMINTNTGKDTHALLHASWLIAAAERGDVPALNFLLDKGISPDRQNATGVTALMAAAARGNLPGVRLLLARGANTQLRDHAGHTALDWGRVFVFGFMLLKIGAADGSVNETAPSESEVDADPMIVMLSIPR